MKNIKQNNETIQHENEITKFLDRKHEIFNVKAPLSPIEERVIKDCLTKSGYEKYARWMNCVNSYLTLLPLDYEEVCLKILQGGLQPILDFCENLKCTEYKLSTNPSSEFEVLASDAFQFNCEMELIAHIELEVFKAKFNQKNNEDTYEL